ncbi:lactonase family protein [Tundrisphaera sp. TA3]|uniref:lactonase family protein n=1 Tax=Tundrisphaera sp. TA3 TaxID=3435775 RepID=UPI003EB7F9BF
MIRTSLVALLLVAASALPARSQDATAPEKVRAYVGTYTNSKSKGIYLLELDLATGSVADKGLAIESTSPSFLALHPSGKFLYAANEVNRFDGKPVGGVTGFAIDASSGKLSKIDSQPSGSPGPCHVKVDATGKALLVANYGGGSVASFPLDPSGKIGPAASHVVHQGSGPIKSRQAGPHAHSIDLDPANKFALVNDLGLDQTLTYAFDADKATLSPEAVSIAKSQPGAGPRHLAFHPNGKFVYVINELDSTVAVSVYDPEKGKVTPYQVISTLPPGGVKGSTTAEIAVHPSGRFVYGSNRGADSLVIFAVDPTSGQLALVGFQPTGGKTPRNFAIDPSGKYLLAANQESDNVVVFRIDPQAGTLQQVGEPIAVPLPVCIQFAPIGG